MDDWKLRKNDFLGRWTLENVKNMTLEEYTDIKRSDSFTYWIEFKTANVLGIGGGSAYKFGIFRRSSIVDTEKRKNGQVSDDKYGWYGKYGRTAEEAFQQIKKLLIETIFAAENENFKKIDTIDLGNAYKWKLAFLYAPLNSLLRIAKDDAFYYLSKKYLHTHLQDIAEIQKKLIKLKSNNESLDDYSTKLWNEYEEKVTNEKNLKKWLKTKKNLADSTINKYINRLRKSIPKKLVEIEEMDRVQSLLTLDRDTVTSIDSMLKSNGVLYEWNISTKVKSEASAAVGNYLEYINEILEKVNDEDEEGRKKMTKKYDNNILNQILYGPPGTGKTYNTINKALEIIENKTKKELAQEDRNILNSRFDTYQENGQIEFTTFHQSYGYEEFVEGIKPCDLNNDCTNEDSNIKYTVKNGIFKKLALLAKENYDNVSKIGIKELEKKEEYRFKLKKLKDLIEISIDDVDKYTIGDTTTYIYEIEDDAFRYKGDNWGHNQRMKFDDLQKLYIHNIKSRSDIKSLEEISGLARQHASYYLKMIEELNKIQVPNSTYLEVNNTLQNYVLIIDEINRGNISKIFGELITLIEDSKRLDEDEALEIRLPYSGKRFGVSSNLYIIGTMNTADRSIAQIDTALRRRFVFEEMMPNSDLFTRDVNDIKEETKYEERGSDLKVENLNIRLLLNAINERIEYIYDREHTVGHSYFMPLIENPTKPKLDEIFRVNIIPLLAEYFYSDWGDIQFVLNNNFIEEETTKKYIKDSRRQLKKVYKIVDEFKSCEYMKIYNEDCKEDDSNENDKQAAEI